MLMIKLMSRGVGLCLTQEIVCHPFKTQFHSPLVGRLIFFLFFFFSGFFIIIFLLAIPFPWYQWISPLFSLFFQFISSARRSSLNHTPQKVHSCHFVPFSLSPMPHNVTTQHSNYTSPAGRPDILTEYFLFLIDKFLMVNACDNLDPMQYKHCNADFFYHKNDDEIGHGFCGSE